MAVDSSGKRRHRIASVRNFLLYSQTPKKIHPNVDIGGTNTASNRMMRRPPMST
jgi:hypothetical protein